MTRVSTIKTVIGALALCSGAWLGTAALAQAGTVTDRFELKVTTKEFCKGNPKFFEIDKVNATDDVLLTITRDVNGDGDYTDISAAIGLAGNEVDVIPMKGRAFLRNKSGSKAGFTLSGVNPGNADHFITIRGDATFDTLGQMINLTKVTGTFEFQMTDSYSLDKFDNQSAAVECFGSGTFVTGKKVTATGGGTLTVANAPASVGGTFVADPPLFRSDRRSWGGTVLWGELPEASPFHEEVVGIAFAIPSTALSVDQAIFGIATHDGVTPRTIWRCGNISGCNGLTINRTTGTATFTNTVLTDSTNQLPLAPVTLNGTMTFTPF